jgi:catalase
VKTSSLLSGERNLLDDEAIQVGGTNHSHATQDLYDNISAGQYPEWTLYIQTMDPTEEDKFDFDPLDVTKIWPENLFPLQPVGRMVLNQNPSNFFSENEMLVTLPPPLTFSHFPGCEQLGLETYAALLPSLSSMSLV